MLITTKAIVISSLKYGDSSLIVKCFTKDEGLKSYLLRGVSKSKKGNLKNAYFQSLIQLEIVANHNNKGNLNSIKEVQIKNHYKTIHTDIVKQSVAMFIAEILNYSIQEEEQNLGLYQYLESSLIWLDTHNNPANFHLLFLLNLTKYLGFYPDLSDQNNNYFNLSEGRFSSFKPNEKYITKNELNQFKKLLGINFEALHNIEFNGKNRQTILIILIQYFELHLNGFRAPKSLQVLKSVFN